MFGRLTMKVFFETALQITALQAKTLQTNVFSLGTAEIGL